MPKRKRGSDGRSRRWVFTLNNPKKTKSLAKRWDARIVKYAVWQLEVGESGTLHLQGYLSFQNVQSFQAVKKVVGRRAHIEAAKGSEQQNRDYCTKKAGRKGGPWTFGTESQQGRRTDMETLATSVKEEGLATAVEEHTGMAIRYFKGMQSVDTFFQTKRRVYKGWKKPKIVVFWGETGMGKTRRAYTLAPTLYRVATHTGGTLWMDGYDGQETILFDDFSGGVQFRLMLQILDGYPLRLPIKGGFTILRHEFIIITSNLSPAEWYGGLSATRGQAVLEPLERRLKDFAKVVHMERAWVPPHSDTDEDEDDDDDDE